MPQLIELERTLPLTITDFLTIVSQNSPVSAAAIVSAVSLCLAAFTSLTAEQVSAVTAVVAIVAAFVVQRFGTDPKNL